MLQSGSYFYSVFDMRTYMIYDAENTIEKHAFANMDVLPELDIRLKVFGLDCDPSSDPVSSVAQKG